VFQSIFFWSAPLMGGIEAIFSALGEFIGARMTEGALKSLVCKGVIGGVGGVLVFLPQICLLFLFIAIMEDCGYMSRAAFLMDRLLSRVGLSGKSFIPMLSSFACAVPGVMATRTIENPRDRLTTILISPLMSCSARLPVYAIMIGAFIPDERWGFISLHGFTLFGMYAVGIIVAVPVAWLLKKTLLKGETPPFLIELPSYKVPDWRTVMLRVFDRGKAFTIRAGTIILAVSIVVWALAYFPHPDSISEKFEKQRDVLVMQFRQLTDKFAPQQSLRDSKSQISLMLKQMIDFEKRRDEAASGLEKDSPEAKQADEVFKKSLADMKTVAPVAFNAAAGVRKLQLAHKDDIESIEKSEAGEYLRQSYFGKMGSVVEPLFKPLGWDWRISMAAIASFPAREVIVATLGEIFNLGADVNEEDESLRTALKQATWDNSNNRLFNIPVALSIMVFFALCSQCAATLATIKRETNSWRWPLFSFGYMTALAYVGALFAYQITMALGWGNV
jgi:ferrous iron transport protein B